MYTTMIERAGQMTRTFRLKRGDLAYRNKVRNLLPLTRKTLWLIEQGASGEDIVEIIAFRDFHREDCGSMLSKEDVLAAEIELMDQFQELRAAFDI